MECYYDRRWEPYFDELFHGTWIHAHPIQAQPTVIDCLSRLQEELELLGEDRL